MIDHAECSNLEIPINCMYCIRLAAMEGEEGFQPKVGSGLGATLSRQTER